MIPRPPFRSDQFSLYSRSNAAALHDIHKQTDDSDRVGAAGSTFIMLALRNIEDSANGVRELAGPKRRALNDMIVPH